MKNFIKYLFLKVFVLSAVNSAGQSRYTYNAPGQDCYCEYVFYSKVDAKGVILQNTRGESLDSFLSSNTFFKSEFSEYSVLTVHIINPGNSSERKCFDLVSKWAARNRKINPEVVFDIERLDLTAKENVSNTSAGTVLGHRSNEGLYLEILDSLDQATMDKPYKLNGSESISSTNSKEIISNSSKGLDLSISLSPIALFGDPFEVNRGAISMYGLGVSKKIGSRHSIGLLAEASFKSPNKRAIETSIRTDARNAVLFGDDTLFIDEELSGHTLYSLQMEYKFFFSESSKFKVYFGSGLGLTRSTSITGEVSDSLDMSEVDTFNSSSFQESLNLDPTVDRLDILHYHGTIEFGFECRISPVTKFEMSALIRGYFDESLNYTGNMSMGLNIGLSFKIHSKGK